MENLPVPEDHTTPDPPVIAMTECLLETSHPDRALATHGLGGRQLFGAFGKEQLVMSASYASSSAKNLIHGFLSNLVACDRRQRKSRRWFVGGL
jgi:hypothetical protein